jgi:hypothetical protein
VSNLFLNLVLRYQWRGTVGSGIGRGAQGRLVRNVPWITLAEGQYPFPVRPLVVSTGKREG